MFAKTITHFSLQRTGNNIRRFHLESLVLHALITFVTFHTLICYIYFNLMWQYVVYRVNVYVTIKFSFEKVLSLLRNVSCGKEKMEGVNLKFFSLRKLEIRLSLRNCLFAITWPLKYEVGRSVGKLFFLLLSSQQIGISGF